MKIYELLLSEAIASIGSSTDPLKQNGIQKTPPQVAPTASTSAQLGTSLSAPTQPASGTPTQTPAPQLQTAMTSTMTDLDKIAAQIIGLKQKQQQMQTAIQQSK